MINTNFKYSDILSKNIITALENIIKKSEAKALLIFGSCLDGTMTEDSDLDFFLITDKTNKHSAFYFQSEGPILHFNCIKEDGFKDFLSASGSINIQSLSVKAEILFDTTDWLKDRIQEIHLYPVKNRLYHIIVRLETVLNTIYRLKKLSKFGIDGSVSFEYLAGLKALHEIESINLGIFYGRSVFQKHRIQVEVDNTSLSQMVIKLEKKIKPWIKEYIPLFIKHVKSKISEGTCFDLEQKIGLDLISVYETAVKMSLMEHGRKLTTRCGFEVDEITFKIVI